MRYNLGTGSDVGTRLPTVSMIYVLRTRPVLGTKLSYTLFYILAVQCDLDTRSDLYEMRLRYEV